MAAIKLTRGLSAIVDDEDHEKLSAYRWYAHSGGAGKFYAARRCRADRSLVLMHREINRTPGGFLTDHIDGDTLNNRKANLRDATATENARNQDKQRRAARKGAWHDPTSTSVNQWRAAIRVDGRLKYLGRFPTQDQAAEAYAKAASEIFGSFNRRTA